MKTATSAANPVRRAFTLIELMVVVSIIVVLVGIVLAIGTALGAGSAIATTNNTMDILETALDEWERTSNRELSWGEDGVPNNQAFYDMQEDTPHVYLVSDLLADIAKSSDIQAVLANLDETIAIRYDANLVPEWIREGQLPDFSITEADPFLSDWLSRLGDFDGLLTVLDAWDRPIRVIHAGRVWYQGDPIPGPPDIDGTVRTPLENIYGVAPNRETYFVSAGPDGAFGNVTAQRDTPMYEATLDNIYSTEVVKP